MFFFKYFKKGTNVALYSYSDNTKTRFYIGEASDYSPHELGYRIYYNYNAVAVRDQKGVTVNENTYMKQLFALANKYQVLNNDLQWDIEHAGYSKDDLMGIVSRINNISKSDYESKYVEHAKSNFYVGGGLNIFSASPKSWASSFGYPSATSVLPEVLIGVNLIPKPKSDKVEFRAELSVADYNYNSVDVIAISIVPQGIYNFYHSENLKLYFGFGFLMTYNIFDNLNVKNGVNNSFMLKAGVKFHNQIEIFANTVTFSESNFINNSSIKAFNEQIGVIYHFN